MRPRWWLAGVVVGAVAFTLIVSVTSVVSFAYRSPSLHVAVETAAALISLLAAQLIYGRFRHSLDRRDLLLTAALVLFAGSNLLFSAVPAIADAGPDSFSTWAPACSTVVAAALLAAGAFTAPRAVRRPRAAIRHALVLCAIGLGVIGLGTALAGDWLPQAIAPDLSPEAGTRPRIVGDPVLLGLQIVVMGLFAAAAVGFGRAAELTRDPLKLWFAVGATLGAFARLNYFLFPSRYSEYSTPATCCGWGSSPPCWPAARTRSASPSASSSAPRRCTNAAGWRARSTTGWHRTSRSSRSRPTR